MSESVFAPYPKIPERAALSRSAVRRWTATEKVHGAHLALLCEGGTVRPAKRRELLEGDALDGFFGLARIWPGLAVAAARAAGALREEYRTPGRVVLYGELFGGRYPHPAVPPEDGAQAVQTGVWYAPGLHWSVFDAVVEVRGERWWAGDAVLRRAAAAAALPCAPLLAEGPLVRLQQLPAAFPSLVPAGFDLPPLAANLAEGYVLKPAEDVPVEAGRPVLKVKQAGFAEDARYGGARPYAVPAGGAAGVPGWLVEQAAALRTPARAASAVSKLGPAAGPAEVAAEIARDTVEDLADRLGGLPAAQASRLTACLHPAALHLARLDATGRTA
ncbi:RNA ligase family protein [Kitasatospora sp. DSM 101779]|uniref:RNA ligase family protein n=1 Tax=Kitasatospora sp. DSM 101779 TaxID=2853165 RepID=UPI0021D9D522|nr:RNA ligase family protein [Kitasatospora sp. DSM 101779]MCU7826029.1 RNA ligase family protein [Kitasatospora sp. DSM 101779]